jgi:hypothetical protein
VAQSGDGEKSWLRQLVRPSGMQSNLDCLPDSDVRSLGNYRHVESDPELWRGSGSQEKNGEERMDFGLKRGL